MVFKKKRGVGGLQKEISCLVTEKVRILFRPPETCHPPSFSYWPDCECPNVHIRVRGAAVNTGREGGGCVPLCQSVCAKGRPSFRGRRAGDRPHIGQRLQREIISAAVG